MNRSNLIKGNDILSKIKEMQSIKDHIKDDGSNIVEIIEDGKCKNLISQIRKKEFRIKISAYLKINIQKLIDELENEFKEL